LPPILLGFPASTASVIEARMAFGEQITSDSIYANTIITRLTMKRQMIVPEQD